MSDYHCPDHDKFEPTCPACQDGPPDAPADPKEDDAPTEHKAD
jgi:hypothetical protein